MGEQNKYSLAPELRFLAEGMPGGEFARFTAEELIQVRQRRLESQLAIDPRVRIEDVTIESRRGSVPLRLYRPRHAEHAAALVYCHGGAFCMGSLDSQHECALQVAAELAMTVVSVDYRLAPEQPFPGAVEDCFDAFVWTADNAGALAIDRSRIAIGGRSSGGCLAAAVALLARDRQAPAPALQFLIYPLLDHSLTSASMRDFVDTPVFNRADAEHAWKLYLNGDPGKVSPYASPANEQDLRALPPAYIMAAEFDPARDEAIDYGTRLLRAGVAVELHSVAGAVHGFDILGRGPLAEFAALSQLSGLSRGLALQLDGSDNSSSSRK